MSVIRKSAQFDSTASSLDSHDDVNTVKIKSYIKELLKSRIFLGRYVERRLIDERIGYRDVVLVSPAEVELKRDLFEAKHRLSSVYPNTHWIGITDSDILENASTGGVCVWTEIDNQPFGPFWFQIKSLKFRDGETIVTVKCLRHITEAYLEIEPILTGGVSKQAGDLKIEKPIEALNETCQEITASLKSALSISNVKEFFTFIFAFVIAIFTGSTSFVNFLGNFILALVREMSILIKNSTPMFLGFLDFLSKIVGGFYILIAMFFKPSSPPQLNKRTLTHYDYDHRQRHSNEFDSRYID